MTKNPILDELHATRERLFAESGGTIFGLIARLQAEQAASGRPKYDALDNKMFQRSGEASVLEVEKISSPPAERWRSRSPNAESGSTRGLLTSA